MPPKPDAPPTASMEAKVEFELTDPNDQAVAAALSPEERVRFVAAVRDILELNGTGDIPGIQASYIEVGQYIQDFEYCKVSDGMKKALFMAHNWNALGRGTGGLAGASVRWSLKQYFVPEREMTRHAKVPVGSAALIAEYDRVAMNNRDLVNFFITNAVSVAALSGAMINRIVHHWDAKHPGAQKAFISAMGMADALTDDQYRPVFYLAIHPLPLLVTERMRSSSAAGTLPEVAEVVRLRCDGPPAGYGALNACAAAVSSFLAEPIMNEGALLERELPQIPETKDPDILALHTREVRQVIAYNEKVNRLASSVPKLAQAVRAVASINAKITREAGHYHQFATKYGFESRLTVDLKELEAPMIVLAAYIFSKIKGSLAGSAALRKFRDQHAREVNKRVTAFANLDEGEDIYSVLGL